MGVNRLLSIILAGRPSLIDLSRVALFVAGWSSVNEQKKQEVIYGSDCW